MSYIVALLTVMNRPAAVTAVGQYRAGTTNEEMLGLR
ncbi:hypothetical protein DFJ68_2651 [Terracoccus luteus]|jgi:hypothetical protein|uniref:Uncharacterized protein n=1 Tax=Terracoccus luteus TaxID=53356 RepID=A0A495Y0Q7_9MICO|nr:hypothetical protein [Terracoccus luteus]MCP2171971.1 hypothetical protein [Terracoccus luteus]RKT79189.1 hypothetical protein DFJ68_2651 [Terracoccus luteus]